jgi:hypothetical protein
MSKLKVTKTDFLVVDVFALQKLIEKYYGIDNYEIAYLHNLQNDSWKVIKVRTGPIAGGGQALVDDLRRGGDAASLRDIMMDLANNGIIDPGHYLIAICW